MTVEEILAPLTPEQDEKQHFFTLYNFLLLLEQQNRDAAEAKNFKRWNRTLNMICLVEKRVYTHSYLDKLEQDSVITNSKTKTQ